MKSITMYIFKNRFKPLVWLFLFLGFYGLKAQSFTRVHSAFYDCDFYRTLQNQQASQITPADYPTITTTDFINTSQGILIPLGDDSTQDILLGSFSFKYFCSNVTSLRVGADGALLVNTPSGNVPSSNPSLIITKNAIAPWMDSWKLGTGQVRYQFKGLPNSISDPLRLIIQWADISPYTSDATIVTDALKATFRVVIYAESNTDVRYKSTIAFYYQDVELKSEGIGTTIKNFADETEYAKKGVVGINGECSTGRLGDGVNATVKNVNDPPLITLQANELIRAIIFKPNACALPTPLSTVNVCEGTPAFTMPNNGTQALNGQWKNRNTPPRPSGLTSLNDVNDLAATFNPTQPGLYQMIWDPGCPTYGFNVDIRVDDKLNILTPTAQLSSCGQTTFTVQADDYPSVLTAGVPQWTKVGTTTAPIFPLAAPNPNTITLQGVSGTVNLTLTNGTCVTNTSVTNMPSASGGVPIDVPHCGGSVNLTLPGLAAIDVVGWSFLNPPPVGVSFSPNPNSPISPTATVVGLPAAVGTVIVKLGYKSLSGQCFERLFNLNGGAGQQAEVRNSTDPFQTVSQCDNGTFELTATKPTLPAVGTWAAPAGVTMSAPVVSGNQVSVTVSGVNLGSNVQVSWTVEVPNSGCLDAVVVTLTNNPKPIAALRDFPRAQCNKQNFEVIGIVPSTPVGTQGEWHYASDKSLISTNAITGVTVPTGMIENIYWVVFTDKCRDSIFVTLKNDVRINAGNDINVCQTNITNLTVNLSATALTSSGTWTSIPVGALIFGTPNNSLSTTAQLSGINYLNQTVVAKFTGPIGLSSTCDRSDELNITINSVVDASIIGGAPQCEGKGTFNLMGETTSSPATGEWSKISAANNIVLPANLKQPNIEVTGLPIGQTATLRWTVTNGACSSSADVTLNNAPPARVALRERNCISPVDLDALIFDLVGVGVWTSTGAGTFEGVSHPVLTGSTNYSVYTPSQMEIDCGEINLEISVTNVCTTTPIVAKIKILLGTTIVVPSNLNLSLDFGVPNCEKILTGNILCQNDYKHYTLKICRVGIVPPNGKCECNAFSYIPNNKIDASLIGQTIGVELSDACSSKATSCVKIEDKRPPIIVCPKDVSVYCNTQVSLGSDNPLPIVTGDLGLDNITPTANGAMDGSVKDCSPTKDSYSDECMYPENCRTPFTDATKPSANTIFACLKGTNVTLALAQELHDRMITTGGDVIKFIIRRWVAQDFVPAQTPANNISDPCYQIIAIRRLPFNIVSPADVKYSCNGTITDCTPNILAAPASLSSSLTGYPFVDINGNGIFDIREDIVLNTEGARACGITVNEKNDTFPTCKGSRKILRTFTIFSDCNNTTKVVTQTIELLDLTPPVVRSEYLSYERVAKKYCYIDPYLGKVDKISYELVAKPEVLDNFTGKQIITCGYENEGTKKSLLAVGDANDCNKFFVKFRFTACDHYCTNDSVAIVNNLGSTLKRNFIRKFVDANGVPNYEWEFSGFINAEGALFDATYAYGEGECQKQGAFCRDITFTAKDICNNAFAKQTFRVYMIDNQKPLVNCITSHTASLGTNGTDRIAAATFNNGSKDNCGIAGFKVRRMDKKYFDPNTIDGFDCAQPALQDTCFRDYVEFTCKDVDSTIMVEMLAYDYNCNTNSCMVEVKVQNKNRPLCAAPVAETTTCDNIALKIANPKAYFVGTANAFYNCGYTIDELAATGNLNNCGIGTVTRTWVVKSCANNAELSRCQQTISVTGKSDFSVDFPQDVQLECSGVIESHEQLKARMLNPANWGKDGSIKNDGCGVLVIGIKDDTLYGTIGTECMIIKRRICVSDWCVGTIEMPLNAVNSGLELNQSNRIFRDWGNATDSRYRDGYICYTQIIKVVDITAPDLVPQPDRTICFETGFCRGALKDTLVASDKCGAAASSSFLKYSWTILAPASGKEGDALVELPNGSGMGAIVTYPNLSAGVYTIRWTASDQCGNLQFIVDEFVLTLKDCEAPSIVSNLKIAALGGIPLGGNGMVTVCVQDLLPSMNDNCTNATVLRQNARLVRQTNSFIYPVNVGDTCAMINCTDLADSARLVLWTRDEAGISNYARVAIKVQDNLGVCRTSPGIAAASGTILNDKNVAIQNAHISASIRGNATSLNSAMTSNTGGFALNNLILGQGYDFRVAKEDEVYAGVTTLDIAMISRHLLEVEKLRTPCSIIAADVDGNRVVDGADMLHLRNFILRKTSSLPAGAWKFIDKKYTFINPNEPLSEDFPQIVTVANMSQNLSLGFTAVKVGDVNNTYRPQVSVNPAPRSSNTLTFETEDKTLEAGKMYSIKLKSNDFKSSDYQFTLGITEGVATIKSVEAGNLPNMGNSNFAVFKNAVTTSWNGVSKETEVEALTLTFVAHQNVKLSEVLTINSSITPSEAQNTEGPSMKIQLTFGNNVAKEVGEFALYQNRPNPMLNSTAIGFNLPKEGEATLTIYNIEGKAMKVVNSTFKAGYNEVMVERETFQTSGVYYYRLETSEHSATKKMVVSF
jgi:hypothetical protein